MAEKPQAKQCVKESLFDLLNEYIFSLLSWAQPAIDIKWSEVKYWDSWSNSDNNDDDDDI